MVYIESITENKAIEYNTTLVASSTYQQISEYYMYTDIDLCIIVYTYTVYHQVLYNRCLFVLFLLFVCVKNHSFQENNIYPLHEGWRQCTDKRWRYWLYIIKGSKFRTKWGLLLSKKYNSSDWNLTQRSLQLTKILIIKYSLLIEVIYSNWCIVKLEKYDKLLVNLVVFIIALELYVRYS